MSNAERDSSTADNYQVWLEGVRGLARLIRRERQRGCTNQELARLCRPLLEQISGDYVAFKAELLRARQVPSVRPSTPFNS